MEGVATAGGSEYPRLSSRATPGCSIGRAGGTVTVTVHNQICFDEWPRVVTVLRDLVSPQGNHDLVLDLSDVVHLERAAAPMIIGAARYANRHGGRLRVADRACRDRARASVRAQGRPTSGTEFDALLQAAQSEACWACTRLYQSLAPAVAGYLRAQGADDPDDLTNEVFLRVLIRCRSFSGDETQFRAWVFTIAHSRLVDARRMRDRTPQVTSLEDDCLDELTTTGAEDVAMDRLAVDGVHQLLDGLTSDQRDVVALRIVGQMSVEEVATALQKPQGAVKALQRRALAALRRRLAADRPP